MRQVARVDRNQRQIVERLRELGFKAVLTHQLGHGYPDLLVCGMHRRLNEPVLLWAEIKAEGGRLTPDEAAFFEEWACLPVEIVRDVDDVLRWYGWIE